MERFFEELNQKVQAAVKKDSKKVLESVKGEKVYAVALVSDSDFITLYMAVNTYEYMKERDKKYINMFEGRVSEEKINRVKEGTDSFTKWIPAEWGYSDGKGSELNKISQDLYKMEESNPEEYAKCRTLFLEAITSAFKKLIDEKVFGTDSEELTYFISMSDGEGVYEIENYSAKILNSEKNYEQFINRKGFAE